VKWAGLPDGTRIAFELTGPGGVAADLAISADRGEMEPPTGSVADAIGGPALAYLLAVNGRTGTADEAGGPEAQGDVRRAPS